MSTQNPIPNGETQDPVINENETLETIGETTDQPEVQPAAPGAAKEQTPEGSDAPGGQPGEAAKPAQTPDEAKKEKSDVQKRIDTLTRRRYELEGRNEELEYELARTKKRLEMIERGEAAASGKPAGAADTTPDPNKPVRESFSTYEDWVEALTVYNAEKIVSQRDNAARQQQQSTAQKQIVDQWNHNLEEARGKYEDFDAVVGTQLQIPQVAFNAIVESPVGPDVAYYLAQNPTVAQLLATLSPIGIARTIGRIEAQFVKEEAAGDKSQAATTPAASAGAPGASTAPAGSSARPVATQRPKPITSAASAPVTPVNSRAASGSGKNPDEMSYQEYKAWREQNARPSR